MGRWLRRLLFWLRRGRLADELRQEIETHRTLRQEALERGGVDQAATASRRALGNVTLAREDAGDIWTPPWLANAERDIRYALRTVRRQPVFASMAILTIAIGSGALATVLSVAYAVLLRPAPYPNADRIVQISQVTNGRNRDEVSTADVLALRRSSPSLSHITIAWFSEASLTGDGGLPERARRVYTDAQAFEMLGVAPLAGRLPSAADDAPDAQPVVVIGHRLWTERFASAPDVIGHPLRVDGQTHAVIAVMPPEFTYPAPFWPGGDLWILRGPAHSSWPTTRAPTVLAFGLLRDGAGIERARAEADAIASTLDVTHPSSAGPVGLALTTWGETVRADARPLVWLIAGATAVVFLIVCANIATLLLSRGLDRQRELAARAALGAGRGRLASQLLTETGVLFAIGGAAGVLMAAWAAELVATIPASSIPRLNEASVTGPVAAAAMAITLLAALIVGLVPAVQAFTVHMTDLPAGGRGGSHTLRWRRVQRALMAGEIGLALVLICGAAVLVEGAQRLARIDPGFDAHSLVHTRVALRPEKYRDIEDQDAFYARVIDRLRAAPSVSAAAVVDAVPGLGGQSTRSVLLGADPPPASRRDLRQATVRVVSPGYLETLGLAPQRGRFFSTSESRGDLVAVVNEAFARQHLGGESPIGRTLRVTFGDVDGLEERPRTIVGVVADLKEHALYDPSPPAVYVPLAQIHVWQIGVRMRLIVRSSRPFSELLPQIRTAIAEVDPEQAASMVMPLGELMDRELALNRLALGVLGGLSAVSVLLAVIGVYGVTAHAARQRTREIGIRLALGTSRSGVLSLLMSDAGKLIAIGLSAGIIAAVPAADFLRSLVYGIDRTSVVTFVIAGLALSAAVLTGCYFPARRASRIDPAAILRAE